MPVTTVKLNSYDSYSSSSSGSDEYDLEDSFIDDSLDDELVEDSSTGEDEGVLIDDASMDGSGVDSSDGEDVDPPAAALRSRATRVASKRKRDDLGDESYHVGRYSLRSRGAAADPTDDERDDILLDKRRGFSVSKVTGKRRRTAKKVAKAEPQIEEAAIEVIGREQEVYRMILMLAQPTPQCPLLIGSAGVGKKTIVDKFSSAIEEDSCVESLRNRKVVKIDCKELLGKASSYLGGNSEAQYFLDMVKKIERKFENPIFFFNDIEDLVSSDSVVSLIFQSFLQGKRTVIGSVSEDEQSEKVQQALSLLRRHNFQSLTIREPSKDETEQIIQQHIERKPLPGDMKLEPSALQLALALSGRYMKQQPFPIKTINLVYEAATEVWMRNLSAASGGKSEVSSVTQEDIASLMQQKTGLPSEHLLTTDTSYLNRLYESIRSQIVGQEHAVETVFQGIKRGKLGFRDRSKPWGVYLFVGPTGVGKTELAKTIARELKCNFLRFDMGEYQESHSLARLIGSPPGYVGHESGGGLTNELRKNPHSIVLFDEMEKAHPDVANTLLQVFDDGRLTDGLGITVDCTEALFVMTSNLGAKTLFSGRKRHSSVEDIRDRMIPIIEEHWSPEFLGRLSGVIPFQSLSNESYPQVIEVHLMRLAKEVADEHEMALTWSDRVIPFLLTQHTGDMRTGIRGLCERVKIDVYDALADAREGGSINDNTRVTLDVQHEKLFAHTSRRR